MSSTDETAFDVVVVGSGAAGMTAALTAAKRGLSVVVVEKAGKFGGSTARSGGGVWIPNNSVLRKAGIKDTPERAAAYLRTIVAGVTSEELQHAFLDNGPEMLDFVLANSPLRLAWVRGYSDYYPEAEGGRPRGRSVEPRPFNARLLGAEQAHLNPPYLPTPAGFPITQFHYKWITLLARHPRGLLSMLQIGTRWLLGLARGERLLTMGQALAAGLRAGLLRAGVPVWLNTSLRELTVTDGRVSGIVVERDGREQAITARHGVLLSAGGFEHNEAMRQKYQRPPIGTEWTVGAKENTGDAIALGQRLGAAVELMDDSWWGPSVPLTGGPYFCLSERTLPGCVMVNERGLRFVNEAAPYVDAVHAMYGAGDGSAQNFPTWLIMDQRYRNRYMFIGRGPRQAFPGRWYKAGIVHRAGTIGSLAEKIGLPPDALVSTVERFNGFARTGVDEDFRRGDSAYDKYYGDPRNKPNPSLAALSVAPFYAVKMVPGDLGTKGGLRTDTHARVLREDGSAIPGLYAAGNSSAPVMGHTYAGPGATIGPAMTFGYLAALDIAARAESPAPTGGTR